MEVVLNVTTRDYQGLVIGGQITAAVASVNQVGALSLIHISILAVVPMALGMSGAAEMMADMGVTMISGMVVSTVITLLFTPVYYSVIDNISHIFHRRKRESETSTPVAAE